MKVITVLFLAGCASASPGSNPHDMSSAAHESSAEGHEHAAGVHEASYDPDAQQEQIRCGTASARRDGSDICWTRVRNPTAAHQEEAEAHRRAAAEHRAGSEALRQAESAACVGIAPDDRDVSPFEHPEDIASVEPLVESGRPAGAIITFRAVRGLDADALERIVACHLARNASLGHRVPEMPTCPLVPNGAEARVAANGDSLVVTVRSSDAAAAREILSRAQSILGR
jgi:hypothetical protein